MRMDKGLYGGRRRHNDLAIKQAKRTPPTPKKQGQALYQIGAYIFGAFFGTTGEGKKVLGKQEEPTLKV